MEAEASNGWIEMEGKGKEVEVAAGADTDQVRLAVEYEAVVAVPVLCFALERERLASDTEADLEADLELFLELAVLPEVGATTLLVVQLALVVIVEKLGRVVAEVVLDTDFGVMELPKLNELEVEGKVALERKSKESIDVGV